MKKIIALTILACLTMATTSQGEECVTFDFEGMDTGASVTGADAVSPLLTITGTNMQVVEEGQPSGLLAYNSDGTPDGENWLPLPNTKAFGNDVFADQGLTDENLRIDFNPGLVVSYFEIQIFDYADWFPLADDGLDPRQVTLKAYDSGDLEIGSSTVSKSYGSPANDVTQGGVDTISVSGTDIAYVELTFVDVDPGVSFDNIEICYTNRLIEVDVDIKGGSCPNPFNPKSKGSVPVAILGSADFVADIDPESIKLIGVAALDEWIYEDSTQPGDYDPADCYDCFDADDPANFNCDLWKAWTDDEPPVAIDPPILGEDGIDDSYCGDGYDELVVKFDTQALAAAIAAAGGADKNECVELVLTGTLFDGTPIEGSDSVVVLKAIASTAP